MEKEPGAMAVDDDKDVLMLIEAQVQVAAVVIETYTDPHQALSAFAAYPGSYSLIFTDRDYGRVDIDGEGFARKIRELATQASLVKPPRLVMITGDKRQFTIEDLRRLKELGIDSVLGKPFTLSEILAEVEAARAHNP